MVSELRLHEQQASQRFAADSDSISPLFEASALLQGAGFKHAFFTRVGGVSKFPLDSLNLAAHATGDDPIAVRENMQRCAKSLGVGLEKLYMPSQIHGTNAVVLAGTEDREDVLLRQADIIASSATGIACAIRSADCVSILLADRSSGAVTAVHSGWVGTTSNAVAAGVEVLRRIAPAADIIAAIGPHIEQCCFEVGDDVAERLANASNLGTAVVDRFHAKPHVNLRRIIRAQLMSAGVGEACIDDVCGCTVCNVERYFSYRRDANRSGRMLAAIVTRSSFYDKPSPVVADE